MTVESNIAIAMATLSENWLKNVMPDFQPMSSKTKANHTLYARFSRALRKLQTIAWNSDWFFALFARDMIGRSNYFGLGVSTVI